MTNRIYRTFTKQFKLNICKQIADGTATKSQLIREHSLSPSVVDRWLAQYHAKGKDAFEGSHSRANQKASEARIRELEAALGRAHLEIEFLRVVIEKKSSPRGKGTR
jgi:transposase